MLVSSFRFINNGKHGDKLKYYVVDCHVDDQKSSKQGWGRVYLFARDDLSNGWDNQIWYYNQEAHEFLAKHFNLRYGLIFKLQ